MENSTKFILRQRKDEQKHLIEKILPLSQRQICHLIYKHNVQEALFPWHTAESLVIFSSNT